MSDESIPARAPAERLQATDDPIADVSSAGSATIAGPETEAGPRRRRGVAVGIAAAAIVAVIAAPLGALAVSDASGTAEASLDAVGGPVDSARLTEPTADVEGVDLHIAPTVDTTVTPGAPLTVNVEIENTTAEALASGTVRLTRAEGPIDGTDELDAWLGTAGDDAGEPAGDGVLMLEAESRAVAAGSTAVVSFTVPANALGDADDGPVLGLGAEIVVDGMLVASAGEAFATSTAPAPNPTSLAIVYPLTVPAEPVGLFTAAQLEEWTAPLGLLDRQLDAVAGKRVAVGIDPRIIASIRVLGTAAPASATQWLARLAALTNETFPLSYADADVALQAQLDLPALLAPTTFYDVLDPDAFTDVEPPVDGAETPTPTPTAPETGEATPEPTDPADPTGVLPTTEELLDWPYTRTDIAWPADDTIATGDLGYLDAAGLTTAIVAPGNVAPLDGRLDAASAIEGSTAVVADERLTASLRDASTASTETEWRSAAGRLLAGLAIDADSGRPATMLATFDRGAYANVDRVADTIDEAMGNAWVRPAGLSDAIGAPPVARTLVDEPEANERRLAAERMIAVEAEVAEFATVLEDPRLLTGPVRRDLLALLDVAWLGDTGAWNTAVNTWLIDRRATLDSVSVVPSSSVLVVARESPLPTTVLNALPYPATVIVSADPSNGRLIVEDSVEVTVGAESRSTVQVPIAAGVGRGEVTIAVSLTSPTGVPIGGTVNVEANVQADWEGLGAAILATAVALFFGFGIWRNIRRRRRQRAEAAAGADQATATTEITDDPAPADSEQPEAEASNSTSADPADADTDSAGPETPEGATDGSRTDDPEPRND
ncbi:DUF6049 family protein [Agromyces sp. SYSU K20354]|uniref:DUF6049 family protein n=1 Tax=Agromyces cavernae TaxID=2898659 RepID=UPI001E318F8D|nr:DUF6049 family protein [Agromyces cavernae]MCD2440871.1 DUF6049 family protein [Agromyces cavernae]